MRKWIYGSILGEYGKPFEQPNRPADRGDCYLYELIAAQKPNQAAQPNNSESAPCKHETAVCVGEMLRCEKCGVYFKE